MYTAPRCLCSLALFLVPFVHAVAQDCAEIAATWEASKKAYGPDIRNGVGLLQNHIQSREDIYQQYVRKIWLAEPGADVEKCPDDDPIIFVINHHMDLHQGKISVKTFWQEWKKREFGPILFASQAMLGDMIIDDNDLKSALSNRYCSHPDLGPRSVCGDCLPWEQFMSRVMAFLSKDDPTSVDILVEMMQTSDGYAGEGVWAMLMYIMSKRPEIILAHLDRWEPIKDTFAFLYCGFAFENEQKAMRAALDGFADSPEAKRYLTWLDCDQYKREEERRETEREQK